MRDVAEITAPAMAVGSMSQPEPAPSPLVSAVSDDDRVGEREIAIAAGLEYLPADRAGWRRVRRGSGFSYVDPGSTPQRSAGTERVTALVIPPAWSDVWIAPEPNAHLQATGTTTTVDGSTCTTRTGVRPPTRRSSRGSASSPRPLGRLRRRVDHDLRGGGDDWSCAALVRLIDESLIRPGSLRHFRTTGRSARRHSAPSISTCRVTSSICSSRARERSSTTSRSTIHCSLERFRRCSMRLRRANRSSPTATRHPSTVSE